VTFEKDVMLALHRHGPEAALATHGHSPIGFGQMIPIETFNQCGQLVNHQHPLCMPSAYMSKTSALDPGKLIPDHLLLLLELVQPDVARVKRSVQSRQLLDQL
jgi:hypothetical protein